MEELNSKDLAWVVVQKMPRTAHMQIPSQVKWRTSHPVGWFLSR